MKNKNNNAPATSKLNLLRQICNFIPEFLVSKIARETKVDVKARTALQFRLFLGACVASCSSVSSLVAAGRFGRICGA
jgi:hypothetical protein